MLGMTNKPDPMSMSEPIRVLTGNSHVDWYRKYSTLIVYEVGNTRLF